MSSAGACANSAVPGNSITARTRTAVILRLDHSDRMAIVVVSPLMTRRQLLAGLSALPVSAQPKERYRLGVMATTLAALPLDDAMTRIRKIGYRYISMSRRHANEP